MATPGYTWYAGTLIDGRITTQLDVASSQWSVVMDDAGTMQVVMALADSKVAASNPRLVAEPCRCFIALAYVDADGTETFLCGGPVWTHAYDDTTKQLTIGAAGVWSYYDHRMVLPVLTLGQNPSTLTTNFTSSLGTIAKKLVQLAHTHTSGSLPIVLPADEAGSMTLAYDGGSMTQVGQAMRDLTTTQGGPEIQFVPRRSPTDGRFLQWVMRVGTAEIPLLTQTGDDWQLDATVPKSNVGAIGVNLDGTTMATTVYEGGAAVDSSTLYSVAVDTTLTAAGFPLLELNDTTFSGETVQANLDADAAGVLAHSLHPTETWTVTVTRDDRPNVAAWSIGDWVQTTVGDSNPYIQNGSYRARVQQLSGDSTGNVQLQLAPTFGDD